MNKRKGMDEWTTLIDGFGNGGSGGSGGSGAGADGVGGGGGGGASVRVHSIVGADRPLEGVWVQPGAPYLIANVRTLLEPTTLGLAGRGKGDTRNASTRIVHASPHV